MDSDLLYYKSASENPRSTTAENYRETITTIAQELIGAPSVRYDSHHPECGGSPTKGFDCSGFVGYVLREAGLVIPNFIGLDGMTRPIRHASEFWDHYGVATHSDFALPGDLIVFSRHGVRPTHIGILFDQTTYIHAPGVDESYVKREIITPEIIARRAIAGQIYGRNPIGFKTPTVPIDQPTYRWHQRTI